MTAKTKEQAKKETAVGSRSLVAALCRDDRRGGGERQTKYCIRMRAKIMHQGRRRGHRITLGGRHYASCSGTRCEWFLGSERRSTAPSGPQSSAGEDAR